MLEYDLGGQPSAAPAAAGADLGPGARTRRAGRGASCTHRNRRTTRPCAPCTPPATWRAVKAASEPGGPGRPVGHGLAPTDNPIFAHMHDLSALIAGGSVEAARAIAVGRGRPGGQHRRRAAPRDGRPRLRLLHLQRCRAGHHGRCWTPGVQRIAYVDVDVHHGDGVQAAFYSDPRVLTVSIARVAAHPLAGDRLARRVRPGPGGRNRGQHPGAGRHRRRRVAARVPRSGSRCGAGVPPRGAGHPARCRLPPGGPAGRPELLTVDGHLAVVPGAARTRRDGGRRSLAGPRRRWLLAGPGGPAVLDASAGNGSRSRPGPSARRCRATGRPHAVAARPYISPPIDMSDGSPDGPLFSRWDGVRRTARSTRRSPRCAGGVYPLHGARSARPQGLTCPRRGSRDLPASLGGRRPARRRRRRPPAADRVPGHRGVARHALPDE